MKVSVSRCCIPFYVCLVPVLWVSLLLPSRSYAISENAGGDTVILESEGKQDETILDQTHAFITDTLVRPVVWFDSFFGEYRSLEEGYSKTYAIWQNDFRLEQSKGLIYETRVRAHIRLPKAEEKLKLVLSRDGDPVTEDEQDFSKRPARDVEEDLFLGLGYDMFNTLFSRLTLTGGFRFSVPIGEWVRLRYRYAYDLDLVTLFRFTQTLSWDSSEGVGEKTVFDLERKLNSKTLLRYTLSGTYSESTTGYEYDAEISFLHQLSSRRAVTLDFAANGATRPWITIWNYRVGSRYRQRFYRKWLYYEIVPEVTWPKDEITGKRDAVAAITLRFEVQFRGKEG